VYRSTTSGFTPGLANRIAAGLAATTFTDSSALASGTTYYYVVRATDEGNGVEETNTVERSGSTLGGAATVINETFASGNPPTGWTVVNGGTGTQTWTTTNPGTRFIPAALVAPVEIIDSDLDGQTATQDDSLISPAFSALGATFVSLVFDTYFVYWSESFTSCFGERGGIPTSSHLGLAEQDVRSPRWPGASTSGVRFRYVGSWGFWWMVTTSGQVTGSCSVL
jgi:hypothetical protein